MNRRFRKKLSVFLGVLLLLGSLICVSQAFAEPQIQMRGTILAPGEKGGVNAYVLWTQNQKWHYNVTGINVTDTVGTAASGWSILQEVSPSQINLVGNKKLIKSFADAATPGKELQISGVLYVADGVMLLSSFSEVKK